MSTDLPTRARVVIVGGGIIGCSVAYHLAALGCTDVVLLEQGRLSGGTTWHAAGLVGQLRASESGTRLVQYSAQLYSALESETGVSTGFKRSGAINVARTPDRMIQLRRTAAAAAAFDLECELISAARAKEMYPLLAAGDLQGAIWLPGDATVHPGNTTLALAKGASDRGVQIVEQIRVVGISSAGGAVAGVRTDRGDIEAEIVVNCAGQWAKAVGDLCGVDVPLHSSEHIYAITDPIDGVTPTLPILRDPDGFTYFREEAEGGLIVGGFEPRARPWLSPDRLPYPFEFQLLGDDWNQFEVLKQNAITRLPILATAGMKKFYNGPESFTPDNQFILGEAAELRNFFVAAGFNSVGIASAGGAGRELAQWILDGEPASDLTGVDIRRFAPFNGNNQWLHDRVAEILGLHYAMPWPNRELETARPFRRSPAYHLLAAAGASFGSKMGWERANVFAPVGVEPLLDYSWGKPTWIPWSEQEQRATREAVALFDQTSFGKLLITGAGATHLLQWLCTADIDVEIGRAVYTGMLNSAGGYEADITLTRLAADEFLLVTGAGSVVRDRAWITRHTTPGAHVNVVDVTSAYAVYGVMGPRSRELLETISRSDFSNDGFAFGTSRPIDLGYSTVRATRITYVGELGWELYVPAEFAVGVYELLVEAGQRFGLRNAGYYSINSLRLDKGYRAFGTELTPAYNPVEAGLLFACKLKSGIPFLGREAVIEAREQGPARRLVSLVIGDADIMLWGGELILRDGIAAGQVMSAGWSATFGSCVAIGYLWTSDRSPVTTDFLSSGCYQVDVAGTLAAASISVKAPFDPANDKLAR
jgi:glycine cleavage system aminomethyltransferase T/glycine/D-amino acid oxidase-like deaminating enzyme